jgi:hypothetical protein
MIDLDLTFAIIGAVSLIVAISCVRAVHSRENLKRERELTEAKAHLERYFAKVEELLACEPPERLLDILGKLNFLFNDKNALAFFERMNGRDEELVSAEPQTYGPVRVSDENMHLYSLFLEASVEMIMAFGKRHPHLAHMWDDALPRFVAAPAEATADMARRAQKLLDTNSFELAPAA